MSEYILEVTDGWKPVECTEEIVRCRDCVHYDDYLGSCLRGNDNGRSAVPDGFCKWGERKVTA